MPGFSKWDYAKKERNIKIRHIEVDGAIVNIRTGLRDTKGRRVTHVEIIPDEYATQKWRVFGSKNTRVVKLKHPYRKKRSKRKGLPGVVKVASGKVL